MSALTAHRAPASVAKEAPRRLRRKPPSDAWACAVRLGVPSLGLASNLGHGIGATSTKLGGARHARGRGIHRARSDQGCARSREQQSDRGGKVPWHVTPLARGETGSIPPRGDRGGWDRRERERPPRTEALTVEALARSSRERGPRTETEDRTRLSLSRSRPRRSWGDPRTRYDAVRVALASGRDT